ncbi:MAG: TolC family protein [Cyanobium sp. PLM2.Bin73]|nr:MAG: TolC family protein [Cyanobium sp. PLM2.Bin73]
MTHSALRLVLLGALGLPLASGAVIAEERSAADGDGQALEAEPAPAAQESTGPPVYRPSALPDAIDVKGERPRVNPRLVAPAATELGPDLEDLPAPDSLALPTRPEQVQIRELRPLTLSQVETLVEVNNPNLKAIASQVDQAQSNLRAQIAQRYPTIDLRADSVPVFGASRTRTELAGAPNRTSSDERWRVAASLLAQWAVIDPTRDPSIAAARDQFERAKFEYIVALRDLRLQANQAYFELQRADDGVRIGQQSVRASLVSLRDTRARFQAGVATRLDVLEAETQLARDQQLLTNGLAAQAINRRALAELLDLPQDVTPTAADPPRVLGMWQPSLQESIVAAFAFREELDQTLLDIAIANSQADAALGQVRPFLNVFAGLDTAWTDFFGTNENRVKSTGNIDASVGLNFNWRLFDGGRASAEARSNRQRAEESSFRFAERRDNIRRQVEESFYELEKNNRNIATTAREVIQSRESLRLARLRLQAGVTTQREVVDNQRDLTQAEVRYSAAITDYNIRLAELRRRTGLDVIVSCPVRSLPAEKPRLDTDIPVEPTPLLPACQASEPGLL